MISKTRTFIINVAIIIAILYKTNIVLSDDNSQIPADRSQVDSWFNKIVGPLSQRKSTLEPALVSAEAAPKVIKVMQDGSGEFKTITAAINSIPTGNNKRVIIKIGPGNYKEKIKIERSRPFITFLGNPKNMPNLTFDGTAKKYGTVDSATLIVMSDYFVAANIAISNSAARPDARRSGGQAVALRTSGDKSAFYNCKIYGFQDTVCDDRNNHLFKDCLIQGTVDYIFGSGKSLYLKTELRTLGTKDVTVIVAQARKSESEDYIYSFVHCDLTGTGTRTFLGRAWLSHAKVAFAYSTMTKVIHPEGWCNNLHSEYNKTLFFGEYKNTGPGADTKKRVKFTKQLSDGEAKPFITLGIIQGSRWLLPPPNF
ncbi:unnamed protein product [Vicia faba]|uniref:Pectinesterase n=1 Tax=Vicia faba TaxID=3906 RepID=A0AAV0ZFI4_VICFA|nr:unnamed protein product [Vicia faba]CAI8595572.1 unnamed protein product [Vicia faba]